MLTGIRQHFSRRTVEVACPPLDATSNENERSVKRESSGSCHTQHDFVRHWCSELSARNGEGPTSMHTPPCGGIHSGGLPNQHHKIAPGAQSASVAPWRAVRLASGRPVLAKEVRVLVQAVSRCLPHDTTIRFVRSHLRLAFAQEAVRGLPSLSPRLVLHMMTCAR